MRRRFPVGRAGRALLHDVRGATAIEFAILAVPFIMTMLAIAEYGYVYMLDVSLDNATAAAARQIRTGQMQTSTDPSPAPDRFRKLVCANATWMSDCQATLKVQATTLASWTGASSSTPVTNGVLNDGPFNMGSDGCIVLVKTFYPWTMISPSLWTGLNKLKNNQVLLSAGSIILNEPYSSGSSTPPPATPSC